MGISEDDVLREQVTDPQMGDFQEQYKTEEGLNPGLLYALVKTRRAETEREISILINHGEEENINVLEGHLHELKEQEEVLKTMMEDDSEVL